MNHQIKSSKNSTIDAQPSGIQRAAGSFGRIGRRTPGRLASNGLRSAWNGLSGNQLVSPIFVISSCRNAVCLSYNANRTQELGRAGSGMRVAFLLLGQNQVCSSRRRQPSTAIEHADSPKPSSTILFSHQLPSASSARSAFIGTRQHLCREFRSRQDFRKAIG